MAAVAVTISIDTGWSADDVWNYFGLITSLLAVGSSVGLALAVHNWLDAPPERSVRADPLDFLVQDRKSSLTAALCAGTVLSLSVFPLLAIVVLADFIIVAVATGWSHEPILAEAVAALAVDELSDGLLVTIFIGGAGTVLALLVLLTRAWPRFLLTRLVLAAQRRLPWHLMTFLADARRRQLLRQSGGTYQFRHVRLQERLASRSLAEDRELPDPRVVSRQRRRLTVTVAVVVVALCLILSKALPSDTSQATSITGDIDGIVLSPDGSTALTVSGGEITRWDAGTGTLTGLRYRPHLPSTEGLLSLTETADGRIVAYQGARFACGTPAPAGNWDTRSPSTSTTTRTGVTAVSGTWINPSNLAVTARAWPLRADAACWSGTSSKTLPLPRYGWTARTSEGTSD